MNYAKIFQPSKIRPVPCERSPRVVSHDLYWEKITYKLSSDNLFQPEKKNISKNGEGDFQSVEVNLPELVTF